MLYCCLVKTLSEIILLKTVLNIKAFILLLVCFFPVTGFSGDLTPAQKQAIEEVAKRIAADHVEQYRLPEPKSEPSNPYKGMTAEQIKEYDREEMWFFEFFQKYPDELEKHEAKIKQETQGMTPAERKEYDRAYMFPSQFADKYPDER